jgi:hypothetical protein
VITSFRAFRALLIVLATGCAVATRNREPHLAPKNCALTEHVDTAGWQLVDVDPFTLYLPSSYAAAEVRGVDSQVSEWQASGGRVVHADYGFYSGPFKPDSPGPMRQPIVFCQNRVSEDAPQVVLYRSRENLYAVGLYWPEPGGRSIPYGRSLEPKQIALRLTAESQTPRMSPSC